MQAHWYYASLHSQRHDWRSHLSRPRMRAIVDNRQLRRSQLCIPLRGREPLMAQQLLNGAQVSALFQQVCTKGMAQCVRMHLGGKAAQNRDPLDDAANAARGQPRLTARFAQAAQLQIEEDRWRSNSLPRS